MNFGSKTIYTAFVLVSLTARAGADVVSENQVSAKDAVQAAQAAVDKCRSDGYDVSAAVVDKSGNIKAFIRADGASPHTIDSSRKKAYTAISLRRPTSFYAKLIQENPENAALKDMNDSILILGGGLPIEMNGEPVGGIGVGGAPGAQFDEACAAAGISAITAK
ncbi:hypothetical protein ATN84_23510 [Paramesorhizobium deserti]|uniref:Heme-binding protein n=1 Tax=Paramesorhizobium deserti TaxID=1494590 RepID=A0A135HYB1_9HYPH|nr:heme-binding protein [Paramesorhizobium deserti]KXF78138.1 hypothetical protein ATN84_23510 [Paramesorhizobium deserti]